MESWWTFLIRQHSNVQGFANHCARVHQNGHAESFDLTCVFWFVFQGSFIRLHPHSWIDHSLARLLPSSWMLVPKLPHPSVVHHHALCSPRGDFHTYLHSTTWGRDHDLGRPRIPLVKLVWLDGRDVRHGATCRTCIHSTVVHPIGVCVLRV